MEKARVPWFVFGQHASQDVSRRCAGQLGWAGRVVVLSASLVMVMTAAVSAAVTGQVTILDDHAALAFNVSDGRSHEAAPVTEGQDYVALGDSYSSGVGTGVYDLASLDCARSPLSYPRLWAAEHHPARFDFVACSGAKTIDVPATQVWALAPTTDLVTITIGGNDTRFEPVMRTCTVAQSDRECVDAVDDSEVFIRSELPRRLSRSYSAIRRAAPYAQVIVLGYPRLFDLAPTCADPQVPNLIRRTKLTESDDVLNTVIQETVSKQPGFSFIDVRDRFAGHGVCSADPWINGPNVPYDAGPYHPNQTGYREGYFAALDAAATRGAMTGR